MGTVILFCGKYNQEAELDFEFIIDKLIIEAATSGLGSALPYFATYSTVDMPNCVRKGGRKEK